MKIGIDIGGSHIGIGLINSSGKIVEKTEKNMSIGLQNGKYEEILITTIVELIGELLAKAKINISRIELIGIAVPGTVSKTQIVKADNLHIKNLNIVSEINKYFNIPINLKNDAKCAAIAEKEYGSLKKSEDSLFLTIGTGIGGAVFLDGKLLKPKMYEGFEIGHMVINSNGKQCNCGKKGCFEKYASMKTLKDEIKERYNLSEITGEETYDLMKNEIKTEKMQSILKEYINNLSIGIANLINIFEPDTISIGGSFVHYKDILLPMLEEKLQEKNATFNGNKKIKIVMAKMKNDAGILGAVL